MRSVPAIAALVLVLAPACNSIRPYAADATVQDLPAHDGDDATVDACAPPLLTCGTECVDPAASAMHCGGCGQACATLHATPTCTDGRCGLTCATGYGDCDRDPGSGCETNLQVNTLNCGMCGNACSFSGATASCVAGTCQRTSCMSARGDCDGNVTNGCETDLNVSLMDCGACGNACSLAYANAACTGGHCTVASCHPNRGNCDGSDRNGCESNLPYDPANCGSCGRRCPLSTRPHWVATCSSSTCDQRCESGWADCDSSTTNGCETSVGTNSNCGSCGHVCTSGTTCRRSLFSFYSCQRP